MLLTTFYAQNLYYIYFVYHNIFASILSECDVALLVDYCTFARSASAQASRIWQQLPHTHEWSAVTWKFDVS